MDHLVKECFDYALQLVKEAGKVLLTAKDYEVESKSDVYDLVTVYDRRIEEVLVKKLKEKWPYHKFIGEEESEVSGIPDLTDAPTWIIDPIDGTANFIRRLRMSAISVGLVIRKQQTLGIVFNPFTDDIRSLGTAVMSACYVADGRLDAYQCDGLYPWDVAAAGLIVTEAGGHVCDTRAGMEELKVYLKNFNYPLVDSMTEEQFLEIFHKSNRCFLVSWLLQLVDERFRKVPNTEKALGQKLYQLGFLKEFEKDAFMSGMLDPAKQFKILITVFKYLTVQKSQVSDTTVDIDLKYLTTQDLNLFPSYGNIKLYEEGGEELLEKKDGVSRKEDIAIDFNEMSDVLKGIRECLPEVRYKGEKLDEQEKETKTEIKADPNNVGIIHQCNRNLKIIRQFVEDIDVIDNFLRVNETDRNSQTALASCNGQIRMLRNLLDLSKVSDSW
nr:unnamed protein product [Callosobruchus analis]